MDDKCPKCGSGVEYSDRCGKRFLCGSLMMSYGQFFYSPVCAENIFEELERLRESHSKLASAARKVAGEAVKITGGMGEFVGWEIDVDDMTYLKKELESETNNG